MKSIKKMRGCKLFVLLFISFLFTCRGQIKPTQLYGTWEETKREYVYFKNSNMSEFTDREKNLYSGSKLTFSKDTIFAYVTYLTENIITPIRYEYRSLKTDTLDWDGNLDELLRKKGKNCLEITIKANKNNGYKQYFDEYSFYLFEDNTLAQLNDYSLHFYKKISDKNMGNWLINEFGQSIIRGYEYSVVSIPIKAINKDKYIIITYLPQDTGINYFKIYTDNGKKGQPFPIIFQIKTSTSYNEKIFVYKIESSCKNLFFTIGDANNSLYQSWEVRYKFVDKVRIINFSKSIIHRIPNKPTKMYLIKGDEVEILEDNGEWLKIRYYGKKTIEGWIKKSDVE